MQETGPTAFSPYPRRSERLTICRCHYKGSMFSSVIKRPWVLVRGRFEVWGFEPATSRTAIRSAVKGWTFFNNWGERAELKPIYCWTETNCNSTVRIFPRWARLARLCYEQALFLGCGHRFGFGWLRSFKLFCRHLNCSKYTKFFPSRKGYFGIFLPGVMQCFFSAFWRLCFARYPPETI